MIQRVECLDGLRLIQDAAGVQAARKLAVACRRSIATARSPRGRSSNQVLFDRKQREH